MPHYLISRSAKARAEREHDSDDPLFLSDWLGRFSAGSTTTQVIPRSALEAALATLTIKPRPRIGPRIGIDIGTGRPDPCVASLFFNGVKRSVHEWRPAADDSAGQVTIAVQIAALMVAWGRELGEQYPDEWDGSPITGERVSVDDTGLVGVCDILASRGIYVDRVNFASSPRGQHRELVGVTRFLNVRAEMHWCLRRGLQEGVFVIPLEFTKSWQQLQWTRFERKFDSYGPIVKMEPKETITRRHGHSPDHADADVLACRETGTSDWAWTEGASPLEVRPVRRTRLRDDGSVRQRRLAGWKPLTW